jgi:hypothetical protein
MQYIWKKYITAVEVNFYFPVNTQDVQMVAVITGACSSISFRQSFPIFFPQN